MSTKQLQALIEKYGSEATIGYVQEQESRCPSESIQAYIVRHSIDVYELRAEDVGRLLAKGFGKVLVGDVGKFCQQRSYGFVIESPAQRDGLERSPFRRDA